MFKFLNSINFILSSLIVLSLFFLISPNQASAAYAGGSGTVGDPYLISTCSQLQDINLNLSATFSVANDIDCSTSTSWNSGSGFLPIGSSTSKFAGVFNGGGHKISGLTINRSASDNIGLFGYTSSTANINKIGLIDATILGHLYVAALVGYNAGSISESYVIASVTTSYNSNNSYTAALVGRNDGTISNCYARGSVTGQVNSRISGLVGYNPTAGVITNCFASVYLSGAGASITKGLVVFPTSGYGSSTNSFWDINVSGAASSYGGTGTTTLALNVSSTFTNWDFNTIWNIDATHNNNYPYLRNNDIGIDVLYEIDSVEDLQAITNHPDGRFIQTANIDATSTSAWNGGQGFVPIPVFYGQYEGNGFVITNLTVNTSTVNNIGVFGQNRGYIRNFKIADSVIIGKTNVGSIAGYNWGIIYRSRSYRLNNSSNSVTGYSEVGGIVGYNDTYASITESYAVADVSTTYSGSSANTAGFVGSNKGYIANCYARGSVVGLTNSRISGFVAYNFAGSSIINSFSASVVSDVPTSPEGFVAYPTIAVGTVTNSFWDIIVSGQATSVSGTGTTTQALSTLATFSSWDTITIWNLDSNRNNGYPYLRNNDTGIDEIREIATIEDLQAIANNPGDRFIQTADIDATSTSAWNTGAGFVPIPIFYGKYEGNGFIITNLIINRSTEDYVGVFGQNRGYISDFKIADSSFRGKTNTGSITGYNWGTLYRSKSYRLDNSSNQIVGYSNVGGLVGYNNTNGIIDQSYAISNVSSTYNASSAYTAGLVGLNKGLITNSFSRGTVLAGINANTAGFVGDNLAGASVINSFSASVVTAGASASGFVAYPTIAFGTVTNSFWDIIVSGQTTSISGTGTTTLALSTSSTFVTWDMNSIWGLDANRNNGYPYLRNNDTGIDEIREIATVEDLQAIANNPGDRFIQTADIDATSTSAWNTGAGFVPIPIFYGQYEGNGFVITNLTINRSTEDYVGVFGQNRGYISDFKIADSSVTGQNYTGGVAGYNWGTLYRSKSYRYLNSSNQVTGYGFVGGLTGYNNTLGVINQSYAVSDITTTWNSNAAYVAGLVGRNDGAITNSYARGSVTGLINSNIAGLVGYNYAGASITNSFAASIVSGSNFSKGLIAYPSTGGGSVNNSFWDITVSGQAVSRGGTGTTTVALKTLSTFTDVGWDFDGSIWHKDPDGLKNDGYPYLNPPILPTIEIDSVEDLQNINISPASNYLQTASFDASTSASWNDGAGFLPITDFTGTYNGNGFVITNLTVNRPTQDYVGIFAQNRGSITNLKIADSSFTGKTYTGSITGYNWGTIYQSANYRLNNSSNQVTGYSSVGGLVGYNNAVGSITESYVIANVSTNFSSNASYVAGLVGYNKGIIANCYSRGSVTGLTNSTIAGLVGYNYAGSSVVNSFSASVISGSIYSRGLIAYPSTGGGSVTNSFWDITVSGQATSRGGSGTTTPIMKTQTTFTNVSWNFSTIWGIRSEENSGYPYLLAGSTDYVSLIIGHTGQGSFTVDGTPYSSPVTFASGTTTTLVAIADLGWSFDSWEDNSTGTSRSVNMNTDKTLSALFTENVVTPPSASTTLTLNLVGQGSFSVDGAPYSAPIEFASGTSVDIEAVPDSGWSFTSWNDGPTTTSRNITMNTDKTLSALFTEDEVVPPLATTTLSLSYTGQGSITVDGTPYSSPVTFASGTTTTLVAIADSGWSFDSWNDVSTSTTRVVTMNADKSISVIFTENDILPPITYSMSYTAGTGGSITGEASQIVNSGEDGTSVTAVANSGYRFVRWSDDSTMNPRVDRGVDGNISVSAIFERIPSSGGGSSIIIMPNGIGDGSKDSVGNMGKPLYIGEITPLGVNVLTYLNSINNFSAPESSHNWKLGEHAIQITNLDLNNYIVTFIVSSIPQTITLKLNEGKEIDFDGDKINDIKTTFYKPFVNRAEITIKSLVKTTTIPAKLTKFIFKKNLSSGMINNDVKELQKYLNAHGFIIAKSGAGSPGKETTKFGAATRTALIKFQKAKGIKPANGSFGPMTRGVVNK